MSYTNECNQGECSSCMNPSDCACGCHIPPAPIPKINYQMKCIDCGIYGHTHCGRITGAKQFCEMIEKHKLNESGPRNPRKETIESVELILSEMKKMQSEHPKSKITYKFEDDEIYITYPLPRDLQELLKNK